jgi:heme-degrading monooxygenase HmoA
MYTRVVDVTAKPGKARELSRTISDKVLSLLKSQPGFVDEITLISDQNPDQITALSFWKTREDAERYQRETFPKVNDLIRNHTEGTPQVRTFDVEYSSTHKITAGKAA